MEIENIWQLDFQPDTWAAAEAVTSAAVEGTWAITYFQLSKPEKCYHLIFSLTLSLAKDLSYNQKKVASTMQLV